MTSKPNDRFMNSTVAGGDAMVMVTLCNPRIAMFAGTLPSVQARRWSRRLATSSN